ncbi:transcriptional regulator, TetR family [Fibrella aestuarina BUZ 2]|uniref:Transcriptional regulator, TetR family n=1 Tax=Fibrella aestuarina BUZ 2 TaxID=1166018 RepID=I0K594_9BACT|nr:TetR/AcrR family transcriptional regulator [Fibrella aestuarina]CCG99297.1 transcriptional regulator, TetR family [Fibrella aestuarina BUZ 2]
MGIVERKEREKEEMRRRIIDAAQHLYVQNGYEKLSIRAIADEIEYSPATIYLYFKDKSEVIYAVHQQAFAKLMNEFRAILIITDPFEKLIAMGKQYTHFAIENPELFDVMFIITAPMETLECREEIWSEGRIAFSMLVQVVQECISAGVFQPQDPEVAAMMIWSTIHGYTALFVRKRLNMFTDERRAELMQQAFTLFCNTLRKGL